MKELAPVSSKPGVQTWALLAQMPLFPHRVEMIKKNLLGTSHGEFRLLSMWAVCNLVKGNSSNEE